MARIGLALRDNLPADGVGQILRTAAMLDLVRLAEAQGYESLWIPEGRGKEAMAQLGGFAVATSRIRLATGIIPIFTRPPTITAMGIATVHVMSEGRAIVGLGLGHRDSIEHGHGVEFRQPLDTLREYVAIVRRALAGELVRHAGRRYHIGNFRVGFRPPAPPIPVYIAALGPKVAGLAGEIADVVLLNWATVEYVREIGRAIGAAARRAGRDPAAVDVACFIRACVSDDPGPARRTLKGLIARYGAMPFYRRHFERCGYGQAIARAGTAWARDPAAGAAAIPDAPAEAVGLIGDAATVRRGLEAFRAAGVTLPIPYPFQAGPDPVGLMRETIRALAP